MATVCELEREVAELKEMVRKLFGIVCRCSADVKTVAEAAGVDLSRPVRKRKNDSQKRLAI